MCTIKLEKKMKMDDYIQLPTIKLACRSWGPKEGLPVLALHGWLDNLASFEPLMQYLPKLTPHLYFVAVDLPGHGHSEHIERRRGFVFLDYVAIVSEIIETFEWKKCVLLGHSMGGGVAFLSAAVLSEYVVYSIFLDSLGPFSLPPEEAPEQYRRFLEKSKSLRNEEKKLYQNIESLARAKAIKNKMSRNSARLIVERNLKKDSGAWSWRSDKHLYLPSPLQMTEEQIQAFIKSIEAPSLFLSAKKHDLFPPDYFKFIPKRIRYFKNLEIISSMPGGHHFHMKFPEKTAQLIAKRLKHLK